MSPYLFPSQGVKINLITPFSLYGASYQSFHVSVSCSGGSWRSWRQDHGFPDHCCGCIPVRRHIMRKYPTGSVLIQFCIDM